MTKKLAKRGFTLIELLVVVLIIGILAAIALPQYQKAVRKARLAEVATTFNSISKGIDAWLLENDGFPTNNTPLSGQSSKLDIQQSCTTEDTYSCYTKQGSWEYRCADVFCEIVLDTQYNADQTYGNKWLGSSSLVWFKHPNGEWGFEGGLMDDSAKKEVCNWWANLYGRDRFINSGGYPSPACNAYL